MTSRNAISGAVAIFVALGAASARELPTPTVFSHVLSGERTRVGITYHLKNDCSSAGKINVRLLEAPRNGVAEVVSEQGFTTYASKKNEQRFKCNEKPSEIVGFYYQPTEGFKGKDRFVVEIFFANGNYRKRTYDIEVR